MSDVGLWVIEALREHAQGCLACRFNFGSGKCTGCGVRYHGGPTVVVITDGQSVPYVVHWCEPCLEAERVRTGLDRLVLDA